MKVTCIIFFIIVNKSTFLYFNILLPVIHCVNVRFYYVMCIASSYLVEFYLACHFIEL